MQTANQQQNTSSLTPLSDPGSTASASSTSTTSSNLIQKNFENNNNNNGHPQIYPQQFHNLLERWIAANMLVRNAAAASNNNNSSLAAFVANMQLTNPSTPPDIRLPPPAINLAATLQHLLRNANNQINNNSGLLLRQQQVETSFDPVSNTNIPKQQNLFGEKCLDDEDNRFLVDHAIEHDEEDIEEGQEEHNENIITAKSQQLDQHLENQETIIQPQITPTVQHQRRPRVGGSSVKTAEVWRFFSEINGVKAATCSICQKIIKATNSSTTGMIRHLKSCHRPEHEQLELARRLKALKNADDTMREKLLKELVAFKHNNPQLTLKQNNEGDKTEELFDNLKQQTSPPTALFNLNLTQQNIQQLNIQQLNVQNIQSKQQDTQNIQQNIQQQTLLIPKQHSIETLITTSNNSPYSPNISTCSFNKSNNTSSSGIGSSFEVVDCCNIDTSFSSSSMTSPNSYGAVKNTPTEQHQQQILSPELISAVTAMLRNTQTASQQQQQNQFNNNSPSIPSKKAKRGRSNGGAQINEFNNSTAVNQNQCNTTIKRKGAHVNDILQKLTNKAASVTTTNKISMEIKKEKEEANLISNNNVKKGKKKLKSFVSVSTQTDNIEGFELKKIIIKDEDVDLLKIENNNLKEEMKTKSDDFIKDEIFK